jgi:hypothetical protein
MSAASNSRATPPPVATPSTNTANLSVEATAARLTGLGLDETSKASVATNATPQVAVSVPVDGSRPRSEDIQQLLKLIDGNRFVSPFMKEKMKAAVARTAGTGEPVELAFTDLEIARMTQLAHMIRLMEGNETKIAEYDPRSVRTPIFAWGQLLCDDLSGCYLTGEQMDELILRMERTTHPGVVLPGQRSCLFERCTAYGPVRPQLLYLGDYQAARTRFMQMFDWMHEEGKKTFATCSPHDRQRFPLVKFTEQCIAPPGVVAGGQMASVTPPSLESQMDQANLMRSRDMWLVHLPQPIAPYPSMSLPRKQNKNGSKNKKVIVTPTAISK